MPVFPFGKVVTNPLCQSSCRLFQSSDGAAVTCSNIEPDKDIFSLLDYLKDNALHLGIDRESIALWASLTK